MNVAKVLGTAGVAVIITAQVTFACGYDVLQGLIRKWAKPILKEYRFPEKRDVTHYWLECQKTKNPAPYWTSGDYNGDGAKDYACILIHGTYKGYGVFALVSKGTRYSCHTLLKSKESNHQSAGLEPVQPGVYRTANDKGYGTHDPNRPDSIVIRHHAINWYQYEGADAYYYWDDTSNTFKEVWISD